MNDEQALPTPLFDHGFGSRSDPPSATVIVVAWRLEAGLDLCLEGLVAGADPGTEVIIVGNAVDPTPHVEILESAGLSGRIIGLPENRGPSPARNAAAARAASPLLLFLDDDAVPEPGWVQAHRHSHQDPDMQGVRGRIIAHRSPFLTRLARAYDLGDEPRRAVLSTEGNISIKTEAFLAVGGFAPMYGHEGVELTSRLVDRYGADSIGYSPDPVIRHDYVSSYSAYLIKRFRHGRMMRRLKPSDVRMAASVRRAFTPWDALLAPLRLLGGLAELTGIILPARGRGA